MIKQFLHEFHRDPIDSWRAQPWHCNRLVTLDAFWFMKRCVPYKRVRKCRANVAVQLRRQNPSPLQTSSEPIQDLCGRGLRHSQHSLSAGCFPICWHWIGGVRGRRVMWCRLAEAGISVSAYPRIRFCLSPSVCIRIDPLRVSSISEPGIRNRQFRNARKMRESDTEMRRKLQYWVIEMRAKCKDSDIKCKQNAKIRLRKCEKNLGFGR